MVGVDADRHWRRVLSLNFIFLGGCKLLAVLAVDQLPVLQLAVFTAVLQHLASQTLLMCRWFNLLPVEDATVGAGINALARAILGLGEGEMLAAKLVHILIYLTCPGNLKYPYQNYWKLRQLIV